MFAEQRSRLALLATAVALTVTACGDDDDEVASAGDTKPTIDATQFSANVDHPLFPLANLRSFAFAGSEGEPGSDERARVRSVSRVLDEPGEVSGAPVTVVEVREFEDGELVEHTLDYYAEDGEGNVRYMGERVDDIEDGKVVAHEGQWLAGKGDAEPGLFMPAEPKVGDVFEQERAPGVAEDRSKVIAVDLELTVPAGRFDGCIKTEDFAPLDKRKEFKFYCAGVGLVREQFEVGGIDLVRYR
jgi:hypothetical protein